MENDNIKAIAIGKPINSNAKPSHLEKDSLFSHSLLSPKQFLLFRIKYLMYLVYWVA
ncbi:hypothetical protein [Saccharolobus islandicus]|uniref:hypothetical protein n=1 Tax=Saccharolobus islandicus TaxID=43080 RepID=UPI000361811A|nr:hypothetical protein [Sulfolobus islandicus]